MKKQATRALILGWALLALTGTTTVGVPPASEPPWTQETRVPILVVRSGTEIVVDLAALPMVEGAVRYQGPELSPGSENWKELHSYVGPLLAGILASNGGLEDLETVTIVATDGWRKTLPAAALDESAAAGAPILALSVDGLSPAGWDDAPMLVFLPDDEVFSNQDMLDTMGEAFAHYFGDAPSTTGWMVKCVYAVIVNYDGGELPALREL